MGDHIIDGEFQSDKYPTCPRGKVPLSVKDPTAQDLLWQYAQRRRAVDGEFADDLETALVAAGYLPIAADLAADEERVRNVVREAFLAQPGGHVGWTDTANAIATRAAKQLASASVRLTEEDREALGWLLGRMTDDILGKHGGHGMRDFQMLTDVRALIVRLLATVRP